MPKPETHTAVLNRMTFQNVKKVNPKTGFGGVKKKTIKMHGHVKHALEFQKEIEGHKVQNESPIQTTVR